MAARARVCACGLDAEARGGEGMFGFAGRPELSGVEMLDEFEALVEWLDPAVVELDTDGAVVCA